MREPIREVIYCPLATQVGLSTRDLMGEIYFTPSIT